MDNTFPQPPKSEGNNSPKDPTSPAPKNDPQTGAPVTVVMSKLEAELAAERARVETEAAFARSDRQKLTTKKIVATIVIVVGALAIFGLLFFFLTQAITGQYSPNSSSPQDDDPKQGIILPTVEGYKCATENCFKATDLTANQILIRDTDYYVFDRDSGKSMKTTIEAIDFRSFTPFNWGDSLLLILERSTGRQGLYSVSSNRALTNSYNYTTFYRDTNNEIYREMQWVEGRFILASVDPEIRLIDIKSGDELARAASRIFVNQDFIVGYEAEGQRRFYAMDGTRILVAEAPSTIAIYDHHLVHITGDKAFNLYNSSGAQIKSSEDYYKSLRDQLQATKQNYVDAISTLSGIFIVSDQ